MRVWSVSGGSGILRCVPETPSIMARLGPAGPLAIFSALVPVLGSLVLFANANDVSEHLRGMGTQGWLLFVLGFVVLSGLALLPTYAQSGMAGYIFGVTLGGAGAVLGCVGGAIIGYFVSRLVSGNRVLGVIDENPRWRAVREALVGESKSSWRKLWIVTLIRIPPNSPFAMTNLVMGAVKVPLWIYVLGTLVGITPRTVLAAAIGAGIKESFSKESWAGAIPSWAFYGGIGVGVVIVLIIGRIATKAMENIAGTTPEPSGDAGS